MHALKAILANKPRAGGYLLACGIGGWILSGPDAPTEDVFLAYGLAIIALPVLLSVIGLELDCPHLVWLTLGLALHPVGAIYDLYTTVWWWDHLAHFAAATLVAGGGYVALRGLRRYGLVPSWGWIHGYTFAIILLAGLSWECYELLVPHLTVYGVEDTLKDVVFDIVGWGAIVGTGRWLLRSLVRDFENALLRVRSPA